MAFGNSSKRKKHKVDIENYYKILDTRANATSETIKRHYIEQVKKYPPETHPEQFQEMRRAYETLRDPRKRSEYDLQRKYGGKLEAMLDEAFELSGQSEWKKAAGIFMKAIRIDASSIPALLGIAHCAMHTSTEHSFDSYIEMAYDSAPSDDYKLHILITKARMLYQHDNSLEALEALERIKTNFPQGMQWILQLLCAVYSDLGRKEEAWTLMSSHIPSLEEQEASDIGFFIEWINLVILMEKWNMLSSIQQRFRKFLQSLSDEDDRQSVLYNLYEEYEGYSDAGRFREALIFVEFAHFLQPKDKEMKQDLEDARKLANIEKEIERMVEDRDMYPPIIMQSIEWFYEDHLDDETLHSFRNSIPSNMLKQLEADNEEYAYGLVRLRKKYPFVHLHYKAVWEEMYTQRTAGMNREQRRRIR